MALPSPHLDRASKHRRIAHGRPDKRTEEVRQPRGKLHGFGEETRPVRESIPQERDVRGRQPMIQMRLAHDLEHAPSIVICGPVDKSTDADYLLSMSKRPATVQFRSRPSRRPATVEVLKYVYGSHCHGVVLEKACRSRLGARAIARRTVPIAVFPTRSREDIEAKVHRAPYAEITVGGRVETVKPRVHYSLSTSERGY